MTFSNYILIPILVIPLFSDGALYSALELAGLLLNLKFTSRMLSNMLRFSGRFSGALFPSGVFDYLVFSAGSLLCSLVEPFSIL